jgi:archaemetzincin
MKAPEKYAIGLVAMGRIPALILKIISAHISGYLNLAAEHLPPLALPADCFDKNRLQYDAAKLIHYLDGQKFTNCLKIIGLVEGDLFLPIFTHVLGEAQQGGTHAVISPVRLQCRQNGLQLPDAEFYERIAKVALHELGHLFNLYHCADHRCLMHFSGSMEALDAIELNFCPYCQRFFEDACQRMGIVDFII